MGKIKVENFMKKLLLCVLAIGIILCAGVVLTGCENLETVSLKNGVIKHEYTIGERFDPAGAVLVEKTNKGYKEFNLSYCVYSLQGFSTAETVNNATAQIIYKNHAIEFKYSVVPNDIGEIDISVDGAVFNPSTQKYELVYDGLNHNINVDCQIEDVTITQIQTTITGQKIAFNGAKDSGSYNVEITVSKDGYATRVIPVSIVVERLEITDIDYYIYVFDKVNGGYKATIPLNTTSVEYIYPGTVGISMYEIRAFAKNPNTQEYILLSNNASRLSISGDTNKTEIGNYEASVSGFIVDINGASNYKIASSANTTFEYHIVKSSLSEANVTNATTCFVNTNATYDGSNKIIVATQEVQINGEAPTSISYAYYNASNELINNDGTGVSEVGVYTVKATYTFAHYVDVTLEATLTITD